MTAIYPEIDIRERWNKPGFENCIEYSLNCIVRREWNGRWHLQQFCSITMIDKNGHPAREKERALYMFNRDVYLAIHCSELNTQLLDYKGNPLYPLDEDQRSEEERLKESFNIKIS